MPIIYDNKDTEDTGDITAGKTRTDHLPRRRRPPSLATMHRWWIVAGVTTGAFILMVVVTAMYAGLTGAPYADPWWHILRLTAGCLSVATVATWTASFLARRATEEHDALHAQIDRLRRMIESVVFEAAPRDGAAVDPMSAEALRRIQLRLLPDDDRR